MEEIHESFVGFAALLLDRYFAGNRREPSALPVVPDVLGRSVAARLDADLPKQAFMAEVDERHQSFGTALAREMKHYRIGHTGDIQVRRMDAQAADFPHIGRSGIRALSGKLGKYRQGKVFVIAAYCPESADEFCVGIDGAIGRGGAVELVNLKVTEYG